ncbi:hypothetical protein CEXT_512861 [Caerostris extrusa]|uniref:Uncharacterized protein n=1 Tax=Caerostris extrusa TaxID=172846 RepID=A0AAV4XI24_CAEEX|nr:hypothetical protein CEXT_512861 [Caerostris extrusa]
MTIERRKPDEGKYKALAMGGNDDFASHIHRGNFRSVLEFFWRKWERFIFPSEGDKMVENVFEIIYSDDSLVFRGNVKV